MKKLILIIMVIDFGYGWETTTHRAIDRKAIEYSERSGNLKSFLERTKINVNRYNKELYESYSVNGEAVTYFKYIEDKENDNNDAISDWEQTFSWKRNYKDLIEAGTMLEDAVFPNAWSKGDGRFLNHFYESQNEGKALRVGGVLFQNAVTWAQWGIDNNYSYGKSLEYFKKGFTESDPKVRRKYQAKMLVSVGHLMHMVNNMKEEV